MYINTPITSNVKQNKINKLKQNLNRANNLFCL